MGHRGLGLSGGEEMGALCPSIYRRGAHNWLGGGHFHYDNIITPVDWRVIGAPASLSFIPSPLEGATNWAIKGAAITYDISEQKHDQGLFVFLLFFFVF